MRCVSARPQHFHSCVSSYLFPSSRTCSQAPKLQNCSGTCCITCFATSWSFPETPEPSGKRSGSCSGTCSRTSGTQELAPEAASEPAVEPVRQPAPELAPEPAPGPAPINQSGVLLFQSGCGSCVSNSTREHGHGRWAVEGKCLVLSNFELQP